MGVIGVLWLIFIVLKIVGVIHTGWLLLLFWPVIIVAIFAVLALIFGSAFIAFYNKVM